MKVRIFRKRLEVDNVYFSSDLHLRNQAVIDFGREFEDVEQMNTSIIDEINRKVSKNDLLVLLGDTIMIDKDYEWFLSQLNCDNVVILLGNHCNDLRLQNTTNPKLIYQGHYCELIIDGQIVCCSHYPMFNWNYQDDGSFHLHGHLHADESSIVKEIHKYKSMDVGIDNFYKMFGEYSIFSFEQIKEILKDKLIVGRHCKN